MSGDARLPMLADGVGRSDEVVYQPPPDEGLSLIYQDEHLLVVDKPEGLLSVPGRGEDRQDCLIHRVQKRFPDALIVHRLDMATSGLLVLGRGEAMQRALSVAFQDRQVSKRYVAVVKGLVQADLGEINLPLIADWPNRPKQMVSHELGKPSLTRYGVIERDATRGETRVWLEPVTGRSHQLRVHMCAIGHPILGDPFYGDPDSQQRAPRLLLHAENLQLIHPATAELQAWVCNAPF